MPRLAKKTQEAEGCLERVLNSLETGFAMGSGGDCSSLLKETHIICMRQENVRERYREMRTYIYVTFNLMILYSYNVCYTYA